MARGRKTQLSISLKKEDRKILQSWQRSTTISAGLSKRAHIICALDSGLSITEVSQSVPISRRLVYKWINRFCTEGVAGLYDKPRSGRKPTFSP